ncbi:hypothetical protein GCM10010524_12000 [Streptomyces mexicanus]
MTSRFCQATWGGLGTIAAALAMISSAVSAGSTATTDTGLVRPPARPRAAAAPAEVADTAVEAPAAATAVPATSSPLRLIMSHSRGVRGPG